MMHRFWPHSHVTTKLLAIVIVLVVAVVCQCSGKIPPITKQQKERYALENEQLRADLERNETIAPIEFFFWRGMRYAAGILILVVVTFAALQFIYGLSRRVQQIHPNEQGHYPTIAIRGGGLRNMLSGKGPVAYLDLNKSAGATTIVDPHRREGGIPTIDVLELPTMGDIEIQKQITQGHQLIQLATAQKDKGLLQLPEPTTVMQLEDDILAPPEPLPNEVKLCKLLGKATPSIHKVVLGIGYNTKVQPEIVTADMTDLYHIAVGGSSGWGKSIFLMSLVYQFLSAKEPIQLAMADMQRVTLNRFQSSAKLIGPVAVTSDQAVDLFIQLYHELETRTKLMDDMGVDHFSETQGMIKPTILIADECTSMFANPRVAGEVKDLALRGRGAGLWMIFAAQNWTYQTLPSAIRDQFSTRVQFKAMSASQSRVLIEASDAQSISVKGRAIMQLPGHELIEVQAPMISTRDAMLALEENDDIIDVTPTEVLEIADEVLPTEGSYITDDEERAVVQVYRECGTLTGTSDKVFGSPGGNPFYKTRGILYKHGLIK